MNNNIIVIGRVSVGKSTLLNAILGQNFFQVSDGITTRERKSYSFGKLNLVDIPGNIDDNNLEEFHEYIENAMAILYVCDAQSICNTKHVLIKVIEARKHLKKQNIIPVLNKIDEITNIDAVRHEFRDAVQTCGVESTDMLEISAKIILYLKLFKNQTLDELSEKHLIKYVFGQASEKKTIKDIDEYTEDTIKEKSGYAAIESFFEKYDNMKEEQFYIDIINNSPSIPINKYLSGIERYSRKNNRFKSSVNSTGIGLGTGLVTGTAVGGLSAGFWLLVAMGIIAVSLPSPFAPLGVTGAGILAVGGTTASAMAVGVPAGIAGKVVADKSSRKILSVNRKNYPRINLKQLSVRRDYFELIKIFYVTDKYLEILRQRPTIYTHFDKEYKEGKKYTDFVFMEINDQIYQVHGFFKKNEIQEITKHIEVIADDTININPLTRVVNINKKPPATDRRNGAPQLTRQKTNKNNQL